MDNIDSLVELLGLNEDDAVFDNTGKMEFFLDDDMHFAKIYSKLDADQDFWEEDEQSYVNQYIAKYVFTDGDNYEITIRANFDSSEYTCTIEELDNYD